MWKHLSAEVICMVLYVLPRGVLRQARKARRSRVWNGLTRPDPNMTPIAARPDEFAAPTVPATGKEISLSLRVYERLGCRESSGADLAPVILARLDGTDAGSA
jgi:hypothetical protein